MAKSPLANPTFRALWIASVASNIGTWIHDVGTAWLMTSLAPSPFMVALVQAASTAPMFFLALPSGALADIVDRRKLLLVAQLWMLLAAATLALLTFFEFVTPGILLAITFAIGVGVAMNSPAWQAIVPDLVPAEQLDDAVTLSGIGINVARAVGPAIGGIVVAHAGPAAAFLLNSISFLGVILVVYRWQPNIETTETRRETLRGAMLMGVRYVLYAPSFQAVLVRTFVFIFFGSALWAHLPLVAKQQLGTGAGGYGLLLGMIGAGAVATAFILPKVRKQVSTHRLVAAATIGTAAALAAIGFVSSMALMCVLLLPVGAFWVAILSSLNVSAQTTVSPWVKARALSVYLIVFSGGITLGSICWGAIASLLGIQYSLMIAASGMLVATVATLRFKLDSGHRLALTPSLHWPALAIPEELDAKNRPVIVMIEYSVAEPDTTEFLGLMSQLRRSRFRTGAYDWYLAQDESDSGSWKETFFVASWYEHDRQHHRVSREDAMLQKQIRELCNGGTPQVSHWLVTSV